SGTAFRRGMDPHERRPHPADGRYRGAVARSQSRGSLGPPRSETTLTLACVLEPPFRAGVSSAQTCGLRAAAHRRNKVMPARPEKQASRNVARPPVIFVAVIAGWSAALAYAAGHAGSRIVEATPAVAAEGAAHRP